MENPSRPMIIRAHESALRLATGIGHCFLFYRSRDAVPLFALENDYGNSELAYSQFFRRGRIKPDYLAWRVSNRRNEIDPCGIRSTLLLHRLVLTVPPDGQ
jgi:hypothetical protein